MCRASKAKTAERTSPSSSSEHAVGNVSVWGILPGIILRGCFAGIGSQIAAPRAAVL
jgi:hypothetical protein